MKNRKLFDSIRLKRSLKRTGNRGNRTAKDLCDPRFPLYYLVRNLVWLKNEKWWTTLSPCSRRAQVIRMLSERIAIFNEVKKWRKGVDALGECSSVTEFSRVPGYCNKCGLCCEVASGMPNFPSPGNLPEQWREFFANGLGPGHRFCPFLWEDNAARGGFCSIYSLRSNPCRLFGAEECDFFWKSEEPAELSSNRKLLLMGRWLIKLVNTRKMPRARTDIATERPKFLELNRI